MRQDLHLTFLTSDQQLHRETFKDYRGDLSPESVQAFIDKMIAYDIPRIGDGVYQCAQIVSAKLVKIDETVYFDYSDQLPTKEKEVPTPDEQLTTITEEKPVKPAKIEMTLAEMARFSPKKVQKIVNADLELHDYDEASVERCLKHALRSQLLNDILPFKKQFVPQVFNPIIKDIYAGDKWNTLMVSHLEDVAIFFLPEEWLEVIERYQGLGREITAELLAEDGVPNFKKAKLEMRKMLNKARLRLREHRQKLKEAQARVAEILGPQT